MNKPFFLILILVWSGSSVFGQSGDYGLRSDLKGAGLVDVRVEQQGTRLTVAFENRGYLSEVAAVAAALRVVSESDDLATDTDSLRVIVQQQRVPGLVIVTGLADLRDRVSGQLGHTEWVQRSRFEIYNELHHGSVPQVGRAWQGAEVRFGVGMRYQLGDYFDPWRFAFDLQPELRVPFGSGWSVQLRGAIPMYNSLDNNTFVRPVLMTVNKVGRLGDGLYGGVSAGFFGRNRVGVHGRVQAFMWEEMLSLTVEAGYTEFTPLTGKVLFRTIEGGIFATYGAGVSHRWRQFDLNTSIKYANFLYNDAGIIAESYRQFGELVIGFFYINTRDRDNIGFRFEIPMYPKRSVKAGPVWVGTQPHFSFNYRYEGGFYEAREYETGLNFFDLVRRTYPSYLSKELINEL